MVNCIIKGNTKQENRQRKTRSVINIHTYIYLCHFYYNQIVVIVCPSPSCLLVDAVPPRISSWSLLIPISFSQKYYSLVLFFFFLIFTFLSIFMNKK